MSLRATIWHPVIFILAAFVPRFGLAAEPFDGAILITPTRSKETVLMSADKTELHVWTSKYEAASGARLLQDGSVLRVAAENLGRPYVNLGLRGGRVQKISSDGKIIWDFWNAAVAHLACGDAIQLPNGHVLMAVMEWKGQADCASLGRDADKVDVTGLAAPGLMEFSPVGLNGGQLVWRWSGWDHLCQDRDAARPHYDAHRTELNRLDVHADVGKAGLQISEIAYEVVSDRLWLTLPALNEVWVLDHSTSTEQAKTDEGGKSGKGGGLLKRFRASSDPNKGQDYKLVSASFDSSSLTMLALGKGSSGRSTKFVLQKVAQPFGGDGKSVPQVMVGWEASPHNERDFPNYLSPGPNQTWFIGWHSSGVIEWLTKDGERPWTFTNQRGMKTYHYFKIAKGTSGTRPEQSSSSKEGNTTTFDAALIESARYYSAAEIQILFNRPAR